MASSVQHLFFVSLSLSNLLFKLSSNFGEQGHAGIRILFTRSSYLEYIFFSRITKEKKQLKLLFMHTKARDAIEKIPRDSLQTLCL